MPFPNKSSQFAAGNPGGPGRPRKRAIDCALSVLKEYRDRLRPDDVQQLRDLVAEIDARAEATLQPGSKLNLLS
jgi:hypothetical protein